MPVCLLRCRASSIAQYGSKIHGAVSFSPRESRYVHTGHASWVVQQLGRCTASHSGDAVQQGPPHARYCGQQAVLGPLSHVVPSEQWSCRPAAHTARDCEVRQAARGTSWEPGLILFAGRLSCSCAGWPEAPPHLLLGFQKLTKVCEDFVLGTGMRQTHRQTFSVLSRDSLVGLVTCSL